MLEAAFQVAKTNKYNTDNKHISWTKKTDMLRFQNDTSLTAKDMKKTIPEDPSRQIAQSRISMVIRGYLSNSLQNHVCVGFSTLHMSESVGFYHDIVSIPAKVQIVVRWLTAMP